MTNWATLRAALRRYPRITRWVVAAALVFAGLSVLRSVAFDWDVVPTASMMPTIQPGQRILVNKLAYDLKMPFTRVRLATWSHPQRGDVVLLRSPADGKMLVKRVVGVPGDGPGQLNGFLSSGVSIIPAGCYFVMGDNRDSSTDSRAFGLVVREKILGRVVGLSEPCLAH